MTFKNSYLGGNAASGPDSDRNHVYGREKPLLRRKDFTRFRVGTGEFRRDTYVWSTYSNSTHRNTPC